MIWNHKCFNFLTFLKVPMPFLIWNEVVFVDGLEVYLYSLWYTNQPTCGTPFYLFFEYDNVLRTTWSPYSKKKLVVNQSTPRINTYPIVQSIILLYRFNVLHWIDSRQQLRMMIPRNHKIQSSARKKCNETHILLMKLKLWSYFLADWRQFTVLLRRGR